MSEHESLPILQTKFPLDVLLFLLFTGSGWLTIYLLFGFWRVRGTNPLRPVFGGPSAIVLPFIGAEIFLFLFLMTLELSPVRQRPLLIALKTDARSYTMKAALWSSVPAVWMVAHLIFDPFGELSSEDVIWSSNEWWFFVAVSSGLILFVGIVFFFLSPIEQLLRSVFQAKYFCWHQLSENEKKQLFLYGWIPVFIIIGLVILGQLIAKLSELREKPLWMGVLAALVALASFYLAFSMWKEAKKLD
ncbi:MAG: hypothetical protein ACXACI_04440 [Candidatus Hodarchaeales archaeon]|jgi:hypothetical protein